MTHSVVLTCRYSVSFQVKTLINRNMSPQVTSEGNTCLGKSTILPFGFRISRLTEFQLHRVCGSSCSVEDSCIHYHGFSILVTSGGRSRFKLACHSCRCS